MKKVLITGVNGFVGSHLAEYIIKNNLGEVFGTVYSKDENLENLKGFLDKVNIKKLDITNFQEIKNAVEEIKPDYVFHLAAIASVSDSGKEPAKTLQTNLIGSLNVFESVRQANHECKILSVGSAEEYGLVKDEELPLTEENKFRPLSQYAVSKAAMGLLALQYVLSFGMHIVHMRPFNHTGPRRPPSFVCSDWCRQAVEIELGIKENVMEVGAINTVRDFTDVRDIVKGYWLALEKGKAGESYNICSERNIKLKEIAEKIIRLSNKDIEIKADENRMRPNTIPVMQGDCSKFRKATGWKPEIPFEKTLEDLMEYWRDKLKTNN